MIAVFCTKGVGESGVSRSFGCSHVKLEKVSIKRHACERVEWLFEVRKMKPRRADQALVVRLQTMGSYTVANFEITCLCSHDNLRRDNDKGFRSYPSNLSPVNFDRLKALQRTTKPVESYPGNGYHVLDGLITRVTFAVIHEAQHKKTWSPHLCLTS